jgi:hypothetical protein
LEFDHNMGIGETLLLEFNHTDFIDQTTKMALEKLFEFFKLSTESMADHS